MAHLDSTSRGARRPAVAVALALALACAGCSTAGMQGQTDTSSQVEAEAQTDADATDDSQATDAQQDASAVLDLAGLLADPQGAYDALEAAGLTWRDAGSAQLVGELWPNAMVDSEGSHPVYDALAALGAEQPDVGTDYVVGPAYVCLGTGLAPSSRVDASLSTVLSPDDIASGAVPDAVALAAPLLTPLTADQVADLRDAAGLAGDERAFSFDDTGITDVVSEAHVGTVRVGEKDCVWYVQQYGYVGEGAFASLRAGIVPEEAARAVVNASVLVEAGQMGGWDSAATDDERLDLLAAAIAQDALVGSGTSWTSVLTGEQMVWDVSSGSWAVSPGA